MLSTKFIIFEYEIHHFNTKFIIFEYKIHRCQCKVHHFGTTLRELPAVHSNFAALQGYIDYTIALFTVPRVGSVNLHVGRCVDAFPPQVRVKLMNFRFKTRKFVSKTRNFVLKMMNFAEKRKTLDRAFLVSGLYEPIRCVFRLVFGCFWLVFGWFRLIFG